MSREIAELRALAERQPELAAAAQLQAELVDTVRRVQGRVSTPLLDAPADRLATQLASGQPLIRFEQITFDWNDVRLLVRQITDVLRRYDAVDADTSVALQALGRGPELNAAMRAWFEHQPVEPAVEMVDEVLAWAARPFLQRIAEAYQQRVTFDAWTQPTCPACGTEPDFAVLLPTGERQLVCGRCQTRWAFDPLACPYCGNTDRSRLSSLATPDGMYRVQGCLACERYVKALDMRRATRPLMPLVDGIATLPLDAAVMQRGWKA